jgi:hypothetical protein
VPTLGFHVADDSELKKQVSERARQEKFASVSAYVRNVVKRDLARSGPYDAMAPTILVDLTTDLLGKLDAEEMDRATNGLDQRKELKEMLASYIAERSEKQKVSAHSRRGL